MKVKDTLKSLYSFSGFEALSDLNPHLRDPEARVVTLQKTSKKKYLLRLQRRAKRLLRQSQALCPGSTLRRHPDVC